MEKLDRRKFIHKSALGVAGTVAAGSGLVNLSFLPATNVEVDKVVLGETGIKVPRLAFGTGSFGYVHTSNQHKLGEKKFVQLAQHAYDRGVRFLETADMYGTHEFVGKALKKMPREEVTVLSKVMVYQHGDWYTPEPFQKSIDRFRKELDTDYIDILLLHCMVNKEWPDEYKRYMDGFSEAKEKGIVKKVGLSCHDLGALKVAAESPWADVVQARINHEGIRMDGSPAEIMDILKTAKDNGKGVVGMKIFGCGKLITEEQRQESLNYVMKSGNVDCMTIGFENTEQMDDAIERIMQLANS
jgi:aryl-alcohol dehydrogenase-like predicted oxidoreductase